MLTISVLQEKLGICRLESSAGIPAWAKESDFFSITRTPEELSIVCSAACIPREVRAERGWRGLKVEGPLDFEETGVLLSLAEPLARAGVSIFVVSTYETDYLLVRERDLETAVEVLRIAGHKVDMELKCSSSTKSRQIGDKFITDSRLAFQEEGVIILTTTFPSIPPGGDSHATRTP